MFLDLKICLNEHLRTANSLFKILFNFIPDSSCVIYKASSALQSSNLTSSGEARRFAKSDRYWSHSSFELNCPLFDHPKPA